MEKRLSEQLGQLLIIGFEGLEMSPRLASLLARVQPAGVILFARNIQSPEQTWRLLRECQGCVQTPLFTCVDLEGGTVDRFRDALGPTPSAADVFATQNTRLYRRHGKVIGENCRALGFNVDFAPVLDLAFEASHAVMRSRVVSRDPAAATLYVRNFLAGLSAAKVAGCGKHFPGLGEGNLDSHHEMPVIEKSLRKMMLEDLVPYQALRRQLPMVMVSHAAYPQVTRDRTPASLSKVWITDILRKRIGYRGLVVSDDLEMGGVLSAAPVGQAAVGFVRAGGDVGLVCHRDDFVGEAYDELVRTADRDKKFAQQAAGAVRRVLAFKKKHVATLRVGRIPSRTGVVRLVRQLERFREQVALPANSKSGTVRA
jgi:beta-N-acetylhexosaminidase